ncbi:VanZ family protein [Pseudobutyrivibrio ruminis]|uniref:VanZ family protein n=1 Tax=Pseudobutyrivibrio ruminis TaxID=46206 RepID=UPI0004283DA0|nr:VanZ family protein [Pseudobutyrivibrio ruminis]
MELNSFYNLYENNWISNLILLLASTAIAVLLSCILPYIDKRICKHFGINLQGGLNDNESAEKYYFIRKIVLYIVFIVYIIILFYLVLLARNRNESYLIRNSGVHLFIMTWQGVHLPAIEFFEFFLNLMLFIPMGYLLPYIFKLYRAHAIKRPLIASFLLSVLIENLQLMTKRGTYDTSDIIANTLGSLFGSFLYLQIAYMLTNPRWRKDYMNYKLWKKLAKKGFLYPYVKRFRIDRINLLAKSEEDIWDFYTKSLGMQPKRFIVPTDSKDSYFLFSTGKTQIAIHCLNEDVDIPLQSITITFDNLDLLKKQLTKHNIVVSEYAVDIYTNKKKMTITGPDNVSITFIEI